VVFLKPATVAVVGLLDFVESGEVAKKTFCSRTKKSALLLEQ
jgi:hypothetical protein